MGNISYRGQAIDLAALAAAEAHGKRMDHSGAVRRVRDAEPLVYGSLDLRSAYDAHTANVKKNKAAKKVVLHSVVQFPVDWKITPEIENQMLADAVEFINETHGGNAVFAARLDRDEKGRHTVDVFATPLYVKQNVKRKSTEVWMSCTKHGKEICKKHEAEIKSRNSENKFSTTPRSVGIAMQSELFQFLRKKYGTDIKIKNKKKTWGNDWLSPEAYQLQKAQKQIKKLQKSLKKSNANLKHFTQELLNVFHEISFQPQQRFFNGFRKIGTLPEDAKMKDLIDTEIKSTAEEISEKIDDIYTPDEEFNNQGLKL